MIEAVNIAVANSSVLRNVAAQVDASSLTAQPLPPSRPEGAPEAPKAPYISPYISVDLTYNKAVLQIRNSDTGDVEQQFPTESRLAEIRRAQAQVERSRQATEPVRQAPTTQQSAPIEAPQPQAADVITVQDVTSATPSNASSSTPQAAVAALSAGAQSGQASASSVTVFA